MGAVGGLIAAFGFLGLYTLHAREALLGFPDLKLQYPTAEWGFVMVDSLVALGGWASGAFFAPHSVLQGSAFALLGLCGALHLAHRRLVGRLRLGVLAAALLVLGAGGLCYLAALRAVDRAPSRCGSSPSPRLADRIAFETCSWVVNDSPRNEERRQGLGGLLGWLGAGCGLAAFLGWRTTSLSGRWLPVRRGLTGVAFFLGAFLLLQLPSTYALGAWGLRYPRVQVRESCDALLSQAVRSGQCCAFDISAGAERKVLLLRGRGCPAGEGALPLGTKETDGSECLVIQQDLEGIFHDCN